MTVHPKTSDLEPGLMAFIHRFIHSIEQLEVLCLLSERSNRSWSPAEVFRVVRSSEASILKSLRYFSDAGFLKPEGDNLYRYSPESPELDAGVAALADAYRERRVTVVEAIYTQKPERGFETS